MSESRSLSYETVKKRVESFGHKLLSRQYRKNSQKLELICVCGKPWNATLMDIVRGRTCHGRPPRITIENAKKLAIEKGGRCLSRKFKNTKAPLNWQCSNKHKFTKSYDAVRGSKNRLGSWCPSCSSSRYIVENICRLLIQAMLNASFPKARPSWLLTRNGSQLELDGYNPGLNLAFEYQGEFHYLKTHLKRRGLSMKTFARQAARDRLTRYACKKNGVKLIVVELHEQRETIAVLLKKIQEQFKQLGIGDHAEIDLANICINEAYKGTELDELVNFCNLHHGKLKTKVFMGLTKNHEFICEKGHAFSNTPQLMYLWRDGRFCPVCEREKRDREVRKECSKKGFEVLSIPEKLTDKMKVKCLSCGTPQEIVFYNIKNSMTSNPCGSAVCKNKKIANGVRKYDDNDLKSWAEKCDYELINKKFTSLEKPYRVCCLHCMEIKLVLGASLKKGKKCICQVGKRISEAKTKYDEEFYEGCLKRASASLIWVDYTSDRVAYECILCETPWEKDRHYVASGGTVCNKCKTKIEF